ncbi:MAG: peroxiredoxin-like family protein [Verrucomicrobia bacterium]|nr:peroxiredoxin-like family protein [Verrucomicrobiota bacterium]MDA1065472.1 peroxiredoxin-like family protein [Verrucomicrobiota bacterium]
MSELQAFQKLVIANADHVKGMAVGEKAPDFSLPNAVNKLVRLSEQLQRGPVVLKFYRGEWCPICIVDLQAVQKELPRIKSLGASVIAISPQSPDGALTAREKSELEFEVLSDSHQEVIQAYNLQFDPGEDYHNRRDLTLVNGDGSKLLPVPATFIINQDFTIEAAHVEANYTQRMSPSEILGILKRMADQA